MAIEKKPSDKFIEIQNVRITPPRIQFEENVDNKKHCAKFVLQNVGKTKVFIRICSPQCQGYNVDAFPRGKYVSPGLRITNTVKLICEDDTPSECKVPIYINEEKLDYLIILKSTSIPFDVTPAFLEFGKINAGTIHIVRSIIVQNKTAKELIYHVDLSVCDSAVTVEPLKGRIKPENVAVLYVKLISFVAIEVDSFISIRCAHVQVRIPVTATIVLSRLESLHPNATQHFTLLEFPPTYFGVRSVVNLFVKNYSAISEMFSTTGEVHHKRFNLADLKKDNMNFKFFSIYPSDGMFQEDETKPFQFTFSPVEINSTAKYIRFFFCTIIMHRFKCGSLNIEGNVFDDLRSDVKSMSSFSQRSGKQSFSFDAPLKASQVNCVSDSMLSIDNAMNQDAYLHFTLETARDFIRMHLYATAEVASINVIPESIEVRGMVPQKCETRVLELRNNSENLPIYLQFKKVPYVYLENDLIYLEPAASVQITIRIIPCRLGIVETEIIFQLMFHDCPRLEKRLKEVGKVSVPVVVEVITFTSYPKHQINFGLSPNYIREVGKHMLGVKFSTKLRKAKAATVYNCTTIDQTCHDMVVFPNDTQQSLRPWRANEAYRTIFTRTTRYIAPVNTKYELSILDYTLKKEVKNYYTNYIREQMRKSMFVAGYDSNNEYQVTNKGRILCEDFPVLHCPKIKMKTLKRTGCFVPLAPQDMDNIIVYPNIVQTRQIANNSFYKFRISIKNNNLHPIRLLVTSDKQNIIYIDGNRYTLDSKEYISVKMYYKTTYVGNYTSNLYIIINESTVLTIPILAEVVGRMLMLDEIEIRFNENETHKFIKLENILNVIVPFTWMVVNSNFSIEPSSGNVPIGQRMICVARFHSNVEGPSSSEAQLLSGVTHAQKVTMIAKCRTKRLGTQYPTVDFEFMPLNHTVSKICLIRNSEPIELLFTVDSSDLPFGLTVSPIRGTIAPNSVCSLTIRAKLSNCVKFKCIIKIEVLNGENIEVPISGTVVYPDIIITPNAFHFQKIAANMTSCLQFAVNNNSQATALVQFDLDEYQEFCVSDTDYSWDNHAITKVILAAKEKKIFFLHFYPIAASSNFFYLPIIINRILGPPLQTDIISTKVNYYLTDTVENATYIRTPTSIPCVKVRTLSTSGKIAISRSRIQFCAVASNRELKYRLTISNPQAESEDVCMRIDQLKHPVYVEYESGSEITRTKYAIILSLQPKEKTVFTVMFRPSQFGTYKVLMPVYLHSDQSMEEHTAILVEGDYQRPIIMSTCEQDRTRLEKFQYDPDYLFTPQPVPPKMSVFNFRQRFVFTNHLNNCKIETGVTENVAIRVLEDTRKVVSNKEFSIILQIKGHSGIDAPYVLKCVIGISCSCGGKWERHVNGVIDDSIYTTYRFFKNYPRLAFEPGYPFFVDTEDDSYTYLHDCLKAAEDWLRTQVFFGQRSYELPQGIRFSNVEPVAEESIKRQTQLSRLPIFHILGNLLGQQIITSLPTNLKQNQEHNVSELYPVYTRVVELLKEQGATFTYLRAEYMFSFDYFSTYKDTMHVKAGPPYDVTDYITQYEEFAKLSQHAWLDIVLQIYKSIYLKTLMTKIEILRGTGDLVCKPLETFFNIDHPKKHANYISSSESLILNWLQYHYKTNKHLLHGDLGDIDVGLFNNSLSNGLVFAVLIITYCPYMMPYMTDIYESPESPEQIFHNVVTVISGLEMVNYSFTMTPEQLIQANPIRILMFSTYLFDVLPNMYPTETLIIKAGLSIKGSGNVVLKNSNEFPIAYKVILVPNDLEVFTTNKLLYEIPPKKTINITITYWARFAKPSLYTLLLSGEVTGYRYAANKCISLIGEPDLNYPTSTITYSQELFLSECIEFTVQSPYNTTATYDVQQTYETVHEPVELNTLIYHFERDRIATARLVTINKTFDFNEDGQCLVSAIVATLINTPITMWLYFRNEQVGDFGVKFITVVMDSSRSETLIVNLPKYIEQLRERPDMLYLKIPNRNNLFFDSMKSLLVKLTEGDESMLWKKILGTPMGANILESLFSTSDAKTRMGTPTRCKTAVYTVVVSKNSDVILPDTLMFGDECSSGYLTVPLHLTQTRHFPRDFTFTMESKPTARKRYYYVTFVYT